MPDFYSDTSSQCLQPGASWLQSDDVEPFLPVPLRGYWEVCCLEECVAARICLVELAVPGGSPLSQLAVECDLSHADRDLIHLPLRQLLEDLYLQQTSRLLLCLERLLRLY